LDYSTAVLYFRDYSQFVRVSHIQVRILADRLEIENLRALWRSYHRQVPVGAVHQENRLLVQLMEDMHLVENRGSGIDGHAERYSRPGSACAAIRG